MVRSSLSALVIASSAVVLATSVVPSDRVAVGAALPSARVDTENAAAGPDATRAAATADAAAGATASARGRWRWPLQPRPTVVRPFRAPLSAYGAGHRGLDLAAADGVPVLAVEGGVVTHAGMLAGRGTVTVTHADGLRSTYEPVDPSVPTGAVVETGEVLGTLHSRDGPRHCGARACLHLGARRAPDYLDPYPLLAQGRLALLPLGP